MTEVEFHTGVADPLAFACRLLRKAVRQGVRVQATADPDTLVTLDRALWTFDERDFVPHVRMPGTPPALAARTPLWLSTERLHAVGPGGAPGVPDVLVNLGAPVPGSLDGLVRLIEIVSADPDEAAQGRARWRHYKAQGLSIRHHGEGGTGRG